MEAMNKFAVVKYLDDKKPVIEVVPASLIPKLTLPLNTFKKYKVCNSSSASGSKQSPPRTAVILFLCDTNEEAVSKAARTRLLAPPNRLLQDASSLDESSEVEADETASSLLHASQKKLHLVQDTRKKKQEQLLEKFSSKTMPPPKKSKTNPSEGNKNEGAGSNTRKDTTSKSKLMESKQKSDKEKSHVPKKKTEEKTSTGEKNLSRIAQQKKGDKAKLESKQNEKEKSQLPKEITEEERTSIPAKKGEIKDLGNSGTMVGEPGEKECGASKHQYDWMSVDMFATQEELDNASENIVKDSATTIPTTSSASSYPHLSHDEILQLKNQRIDQLEKENALLRQLNYQYQHGAFKQFEEFMTQHDASSIRGFVSPIPGTSGLQSQSATSQVEDIADLPIWAPVPGTEGAEQKIHLGLGITLSSTVHERIQFQSRTASTYVRGVAEELFGGKVLLASTLKELDPTILLAIQTSLRQYLKHKGMRDMIALDVELERFPKYMYSIRSDLKKASKKQGSCGTSKPQENPDGEEEAINPDSPTLKENSGEGNANPDSPSLLQENSGEENENPDSPASFSVHEIDGESELHEDEEGESRDGIASMEDTDMTQYSP